MINCFLSGNKITKVLLNTGKVCFSLFCIYAVIISGLMIFAVNAPVNEESTAVVLGAQVKYGRPSVLLQQRINAAYNYLNENKNAKAVVTGGQGSDETISEGQCMYDTLVGMGIYKDRIFIEDKAENTQQNIKYSYDIIEKENLNKSLAIVTDSYHQLRARLIANKQNINSDIGAINTENTFIGYITYPTYFVREWIAIPVELLK
ncbi:MAG: YdcF family protein [Oscillospiraceae bacterium]|nr:YdcF family protein [Oscillospiraceae bacterium]